jgi:hypothetical protein
MDLLKLTPRTTQRGCGIYEAGDTDKCYVKLLVTDSGRVMPINRRIISEEDLLEVYQWGWIEGQEAAGIKDEAVSSEGAQT